MLEVTSSTVFSYTEAFHWTCREKDPFIIDSDGNVITV